MIFSMSNQSISHVFLIEKHTKMFVFPRPALALRKD